MGRDSRGDRYTRPNDVVTERQGAVADGGDAKKGAARYGRYTGARRGRSRSRSLRGGRRAASEDRSDRHSHRRRSESDERKRRRRGAAAGRSRSRDAKRREGRHRSRSRSRSRLFALSSTDGSKKKEGGALQRFETVDMQELLQPDAPVVNSCVVPPISQKIFFDYFQHQQQQMFQQQPQMPPVVVGGMMPALDFTVGRNVMTSQNVTELNNDFTNIQTLNNFPDQEEVLEEERLGEMKSKEVADNPPAKVVTSAKAIPSVEDFVPVIPRSLLELLNGPASEKNINGENSAGELVVSVDVAGDADNEQCGVLTARSGDLAVLQAPVLSPDAERQSREARRAHISSFPPNTTREELLDYFTTVIPMVRRVKLQRELNKITEKLRADGGFEDEVERREIPSNAVIDVDNIVDVSLNTTKIKPFAFIELNLADIVTELVEESQRDPERFAFIAADGHSHYITIRRPRDYRLMRGVDHRKVVMLGFPSSLSGEKLRLAFEKFGPVVNFDLKMGMAYAEFEAESDAIDCVQELHGFMLGNNVLVMMPLYDWLKVECTHAGIDVSLDPNDPVSGASLLAKEKQASGLLVPVLADDITKAGGPVDHMKELLELTVPLPEVLLHFAKTFSHLSSMYGSTVPIFPTRILVLLNLFDEEELVLDETYEQLLEDIASEVEKHGRVRSLIVPRRTPPPTPPKPPKTFFASRVHSAKNVATICGSGDVFKNSNNNYLGHQQHNKSGGVNSTVLPFSADVGCTQSYEEIRGDSAAPGAYGNRTDNKVEYEEEEDEEVRYEREKAEYLKLREEYTDRLMHPIHGGFGRVFVEYETTDEAAVAQRAIAGRLFGGRTVVTSFMFEDVLHPPSAEEVEAEKGEKVKLYLEAVGAGGGDEEEEEEEEEKGEKEIEAEAKEVDAEDSDLLDVLD